MNHVTKEVPTCIVTRMRSYMFKEWQKNKVINFNDAEPMLNTEKSLSISN